MAILSKGTDFSTGNQVTAAKLDELVDNATFASGAVDNTTTALDSSSPQRIIVKPGGIGTAQLATSGSATTGVTFEKMQHVAANSVLLRDSDSEGNISAKAVTDTQILIGDGTGFTAASLSGDSTMTNAGVVTIKNDVSLGGNPTTTTQAAGNDTTRIATTAFVTNAIAVDDTTTELDSSTPKKIIVKDGGIGTAQLATSTSTTTGVTFAKMQHVAANTVLVNDTNAEGDISAKAVADTQILIGDGTGFTAAALSGDATMTNAGVVDISDDVALGGNPTTTTQSAGNNTTRVATTAFVTTAVAAAPQVIIPFGRLRLKVLPTDFIGDETDLNISADGNLSGVSQGKYGYASIDIPAGYKATNFTVQTSGGVALVIYEGNIFNYSSTNPYGAATQIGTSSMSSSTSVRDIDIDDVTATDTNFLIVRMQAGQNGGFWGGYFTIVAV